MTPDNFNQDEEFVAIGFAGCPPYVESVPVCSIIPDKPLLPSMIGNGGIIETVHSRLVRTVLDLVGSSNTQLPSGRAVYAFTAQGLNRFEGGDLDSLLTLNGMQRINAVMVLEGKDAREEATQAAIRLGARILETTLGDGRELFIVGHHPKDMIELIEFGDPKAILTKPKKS